MAEKNEEKSKMRQEMDRRAGVLEDILSRSIGDSKLSWGAVILGLGAIWAGYELISALLFLF